MPCVFKAVLVAPCDVRRDEARTMRVLQLANSAPQRSPFDQDPWAAQRGGVDNPLARMEIDVVDQGILCSSP
jgi:hypothetical protein